MPNQIPATNISNSWYLEAADFLVENPQEKWRGIWGYREIDSLVRAYLLLLIEPSELEKRGLDLGNDSLAEIIITLRANPDLLAKAEETLESKVPEMSLLLEEMERAKESSLFEQRRIAAEIEQRLGRLAATSLPKTVVSTWWRKMGIDPTIIQIQLPENFVAKLAEVLEDRLPISIIPQLAGRELSPEETAEANKIQWEAVVNQASEEFEQETGLDWSEEKKKAIAILKNQPPDILRLAKQTEEKVGFPVLNEWVAALATPSAVEIFAEKVAEKVKFDPDLAIKWEKSQNAPSSERAKAIEELVEQNQERWQSAIEQTAEKLPWLDKDQVVSLAPPLLPEITDPVAYQEAIVVWAKDAFLPLAPEKATIISTILTPAIANKITSLLPQGEISLADFVKLKADLELVAWASLGEVGQELTEKGVTLSSQEINKVMVTFIPQNYQGLNKLVNLLPQPKPPKVSNAQPSGRLPEITKLPDPVQTQRLILDALHLKEEGKTLVEVLKTEFKNGLTTESALRGRNVVFRHYAALLVKEGISLSDIEETIAHLEQQGREANRPQIETLKDLKQALISFKADLPPKKAREAERQIARRVIARQEGAPAKELPLGRFINLIKEKASFRPTHNLLTRLNSFGGKIFGRKIINFGQGRIYIINNWAFSRGRIFSALKPRFLQTGLGKSLQTVFRSASQRGLQNLWTAAQITGKKFVSEGTKAFFSKTAGVVLKGVANTLVNLGVKLGVPALIHGAAALGSGGLSLILSGALLVGKGIIKKAGQFLSILSFGLLESKDMKYLLLIIPAVFILLPALSLINLTSQGGAMLSDYAGAATEEEMAPKSFTVTKSVDLEKIANSQLPAKITYTVTITAKEKKITEVKISKDEFVLIKDSSVTQPALLHASLPNWSLIEKEASQSFSYSIEIPKNTSFFDSLLLNNISIEAKTEGGETELVEAGIAVTIGSPKICFTFLPGWNDNERSLELAAITEIYKVSPKYMANLCRAGQINLNRLPGDDWCTVSGNQINITNRCLGNLANAFYSLAHETGHFYAIRNSSAYSTFLMAIRPQSNYGQMVSEGYICSYPSVKSEAEDFCETIAVYLTNKSHPERLYDRCGGRKLDLQSEYPIHYNFIKSLF